MLSDMMISNNGIIKVETLHLVAQRRHLYYGMIHCMFY